MGGDRYSTPMNIMTYFGFPGGDGLTDETAFTVNPYTPPDPLSSYIFYDFDKKAAYTDYGNMPPNLGPTGQVYIIRHSDGSTYSKLQITGFTLNANMTYSISLQFTEIPSSLQPGKAGPLAE
jgi:hypothetical protein